MANFNRLGQQHMDYNKNSKGEEKKKKEAKHVNVSVKKYNFKEYFIERYSDLVIYGYFRRPLNRDGFWSQKFP